MMNEGMDSNGGLYTADDVAEYILSAMGAMSAMKLQKLVYYSQAWALVWDERPLFNDRIEASKNGPVIPELFRKHQDQFIVSPVRSAAILTDWMKMLAIPFTRSFGIMGLIMPNGYPT